MHRLLPRPRYPRRGVTLVEMLVVVALLVLMMTIIVSIFGAATGAVSVSRTYQELDDQLRQIDSTIRQDLIGSTARMNPPIDPDENLGYFEYIENTSADAQGEDTDDCLRFTVHAPPGQPFTGRLYIPAAVGGFSAAQRALYYSTQPVTITSEYAEVIYFLRNGNLYRRVLLIVPELQSVVNTAVTGAGVPIANFTTAMFGNGTTSVSWLGVNDISAHPSPVSSPPTGGGTGIALPPILNTLGSLTNRENRAFSPRFANDYDLNGIPDDYNNGAGGSPVGDGVPDFYPTLYPNVFNTGLLNVAPTSINYPVTGITSYQYFAFPYVYPYAYSKPDPRGVGTAVGWIHYMPIVGGNQYNHAPLDIGDSVPVPTTTSQNQTWWGFPTWRDTMSPNWLDPVWQVNINASIGQAFGLQPFALNQTPDSRNFLYPVTQQLFNDGAGSTNFSFSYFNTVTNQPVQAVWDDDLLMTGVRSFDVKGYDPGVVTLSPLTSTSTYIDLGTSGPGQSNDGYFIGGFANLAQALLYLPTLQHEGRMPPAPVDFRFDPQAKARGTFINVGDANTSVIRMRRTWDSWSTDYTEAPENGYDPGIATLPPYGPNYYPPGTAATTSWGTAANLPVYPSYPPPYDVPLRGIQIQVRVVDPRNERIKVLTIRHDFSDKIYKKNDK